MKILHLNTYGSQGGAARAVNRINKALIKLSHESEIYAKYVTSFCSGVYSLTPKYNILYKIIAVIVNNILQKLLLKSSNYQSYYSFGLSPTSISTFVNQSNADIVNLHWLNKDFLSIADIASIKKPMVWTLHDMWAFCGVEHHTFCETRWQDGYLKTNRPTEERSFDINRFVWNRKKERWKRPIHIVTPSTWLASCVRKSKLMGDWPVKVIPNPIDTTIWCPIDKKEARVLLNLPQEVKLIAFGAIDGKKNPFKGYELLMNAFDYISIPKDKVNLIVFGQEKTSSQENDSLIWKTHYLGHLSDDISLRLMYSAADVLINPSRLEAFGQTASEAHACATPVVCFNNSGLVDIVEHLKTGYIASAFSVRDLAKGIEWVLNTPKYSVLCENARKKAVLEFDSEVVAQKYIHYYTDIISKSTNHKYKV